MNMFTGTDIIHAESRTKLSRKRDGNNFTSPGANCRQASPWRAGAQSATGNAKATRQIFNFIW